MEDEFFDGDICGVWVYVGDTHRSNSQSRTAWFSNQSFEEGMKSWNEISKAGNFTCKQTQQIHETAKIVGVIRWEVLATLRFSDEWVLIFNND